MSNASVGGFTVHQLTTVHSINMKEAPIDVTVNQQPLRPVPNVPGPVLWKGGLQQCLRKVSG